MDRASINRKIGALIERALDEQLKKTQVDLQWVELAMRWLAFNEQPDVTDNV